MFFFTKSNSSEQNICRNRRLKINFQRYVVVQAKTKHKRSRVCSTNISTILQYKWSSIIFLNLHNYISYLGFFNDSRLFLGNLQFIDNYKMFQEHENTSFTLQKNETRRRKNYHFVILYDISKTVTFRACKNVL